MSINFTSEQAREKGQEFVQLIEQDVRDSDKVRAMQERIRNVYYGIIRRQLRYKGQSNIHLHVLAEKIETLVSKEMNAFWAVEPHAHARRVMEEYDEAETRAVERMTNWAVDTDIPNFYKTFQSWLRNRHLDSAAVVKAHYTVQERNGVVVEQTSTIWRKGEIDLTAQEVPEDRSKLPAEILAAVFPGVVIQSATLDNKSIDPLEEQPLENLIFIIDFVEDEITYKSTKVVFRNARFNNLIDLVIFRPIIEKDNVEVDLLEFEDMIVPARAKDLQSPKRIAQRYFLTMDEILQRRDKEGWNLSDEDIETLKSKARSNKEEETQIPGQNTLRKQKDMVTGQNNYSSSSTKNILEPYVENKVLILEVYARDYVDDNPLPSEVIYQIPYCLEKIVRADYLEEPYPHGRRPFSYLYSIPVSNSFYGWSIGQLLSPINIEVNTVLNSVNEAQELINNPFFFYVPASMPGSPQKLKGVAPGDGVPISDPNGVVIPKFNQEPLANLATMDSLLLFADRLTVSPQASGSSQVRNAPRTARATLALLSEAGAKVDSFITAAQKGGWSELMYQIYALYDVFASDEKWHKVTGWTKTHQKKTGDLRGRLTFVFKGNTVNTNREILRNISAQRLAALMPLPAYQMDSRAQLALIRDYLEHNNEGADIDKLMPQPPDSGNLRQQLDQKTELEVMKNGVPIDVLPVDDDAEHIQILDAFRESKQIDQLDQATIAIIAQHKGQHTRQLMHKMQQGSQTKGAGNVTANNIPTDLGDMEGGVA